MRLATQSLLSPLAYLKKGRRILGGIKELVCIAPMKQHGNIFMCSHCSLSIFNFATYLLDSLRFKLVSGIMSISCEDMKCLGVYQAKQELATI